MKLTEEQLIKLQMSLPVIPPCPLCGNKEDKAISPDIYQLMSYEFEHKSIILDGKTSYQPLASVHCKKCGYTMLFNLIRLGVV